MGVAEPAFSAGRDDEAKVVLVDVCDELICFVVVDEGAGRHAEGEVGSAFTGHFLSHSGESVFCVPVFAVPEVEECVDVWVGDDDDVSAFPAVAAVGSSFGNIFFASHGDAAVAAVP